MQKLHKKIQQPYAIMLAVYAIFLISAFFLDTPTEIIEGLERIIMSRSVLLTDYIQVGGLGATLLNSAIVGCFSIFLLIRNGVKPNGPIIMAMWLTAGFAFFGKNAFNMLPITFGVYLYSKVQREPFSNFALVALLSATLSPVVSGITFYNLTEYPVSNLFLGNVLGVVVGFVFPAISSFTMRVHDGFNLYNMGFAGGLISTFLVSAVESVGIKLETNLIWSSGNNLQLAILLFVIFAGLTACGFFWGGGMQVIREYPKLAKHSGRLITDYYMLFGRKIYFNMGITGILSTILMLVLGCDLNGPTLGGIFTIVGFSAFGKHLRNIIPPIVGAIISTNINMWDPASPLNTLAILFSTGLAPIAGQYGWFWGVIAGFLHVNTVMHIGFLSSGLNLYHNGYAAGFVALLLVPVIQSLRSLKESRETV